MAFVGLLAAPVTPPVSGGLLARSGSYPVLVFVAAGILGLDGSRKSQKRTERCRG